MRKISSATVLAMALTLMASAIGAAFGGQASRAPSEQFFDSNGVQIRFLDQGVGQAIILLHGLTADIEPSWIHTGVFQDLARDHRVIAMSLRGHGRSGKPRDSSAYGDEMARDVVRLLDHLRISRAHIVGHSFGGRITAKLLTTNPGRFLSATLTASSGERNWNDPAQRAASQKAA